MNWKDLIPLLVRRRIQGKGRRMVSAHHRARQVAERLEKREYFANATYGGFTFNPTDSNAATETTGLSALFARTSTTTVTYAGTVTDSSSHTLSGSFTVSVMNLSSFSVAATGLTASEGSLLTVSNGSAALTLGSSTLAGSISGFSLTNGNNQFNLSSASVNWNTSGSNSFVLNASGSVTLARENSAADFRSVKMDLI